MPEGVEITRLVKKMQKFVGQRILAAKILAGRYTRAHPFGWAGFNHSLPTTIKSIRKKGKFIYFVLANGFYIYNTLGLTGAWTVDKTPYNKIEFELSDNRLYLFDIRNFATIKFVTADQFSLDKKLKSIGPDVNEPAFTIKIFRDIIDGARDSLARQWSVAQFLLSQREVSGLGVYMVSEALYFAGIAPHRKLSSLGPREIIKLYKGIKKVSAESTAAQTFDLHIDRNISQLNRYKFRVYKHKDARKYSVDGRNIYWSADRQS